MTAPKKTGIRLVVLLVLQSLWPGAGHGAEPGTPAFEQEVAKQREIYHGRGEQRLEGYVIDRSLLSYIHALPAPFARALGNLGPGERWMDLGAGQGKAVLDYHAGRYDAVLAQGGGARGSKANAVAMSIEDRRTAEWHQAAASLEPGKIRYLFGRSFREYSAEELGRFQVITDVIGGFSYTTSLSGFMEKVLDALVPGGDFYTLLQDVRSQEGTNKPHYEGSPYLTQITNADGSEGGVCSWLRSISCVQVTCELKQSWKPPVEVYHIRKVCDDVKVPALIPVHYEAGTPPERRFQLKDMPPAPADAAR